MTRRNWFASALAGVLGLLGWKAAPPRPTIGECFSYRAVYLRGDGHWAPIESFSKITGEMVYARICEDWKHGP